jgi:hypothetical protein
MPVTVAIHRLKDFNEWLPIFKENQPPPVGRWRMLRGTEDRNRAHIVGEIDAADVKTVRDFLASQHMQDVFKRVNAMSMAPVEFVWLEEQTP